MNMMTPNEFRIRMNAELEIAKNKFARIQTRSKFFNSLRRTNTENYTAGMRQRDGYTSNISGDKWLSNSEYMQIVAFRSFIIREQFLTDDKIELLAITCDKEFPVLTDLLNRLPDAIDELRTHGAMSVAMMYKQRRYIDTRFNETTTAIEETLSK